MIWLGAQKTKLGGKPTVKRDNPHAIIAHNNSFGDNSGEVNNGKKLRTKFCVFWG